jgi:NifU-like protein involved in Fe-S cluster formation
MNAPLYTTEILRLAASMEPPRELEREDGRAEVRSPTCGSRIVAAVQLSPKGKVEAFSQDVRACAFGQASAALLEQGAIGRGADEVRQALSELAEWLDGAAAEPSWPGLHALGPARTKRGRHGAMLLPFRALLAAIESAQ